MNISKKSLISILIITLISFILYIKSEFGWDYYGYLKYNNFNLALERWPNEPLSALLIGFSGLFFDNMRFLYAAGVFIYGISILIFLKKSNNFEIIRFITLFLNPGAVIVYGAPRFMLGLSFFIIAISYKKKIINLLIYLLSILSHNIALPFLLIFRNIHKKRNKYFQYSLIILIILLGYITYQYIESIPLLNQYLLGEAEDKRGSLRSLYYIFSTALFIPFIKQKFFLKRFISQFFLLNLLCIITYINPFLNRITFIYYLIINLDIIENFKPKISKTYYTLFSIINLSLFAFILSFGLFGFS